MKPSLLVAAWVVPAIVVAAPAYGGISLQTMNKKATIEGHKVDVSGPIGCTAGERVRLDVTVTQRDTAAIARGDTELKCLGKGEGKDATGQPWSVAATVEGPETFEPGAAEACAMAITYSADMRTDAHQWCVDVTIVNSH